MAALLLANPGVHPSQATNNGATPLIVACHFNHPAVAALLLDHGADPLATLGVISHSAPPRCTQTRARAHTCCSGAHQSNVFPPLKAMPL